VLNVLALLNVMVMVAVLLVALADKTMHKSVYVLGID
jgi:hypothetical protein